MNGNVTNVFKIAAVIQCGIKKPEELLRPVTKNAVKPSTQSMKPHANAQGCRKPWGNMGMRLTVGFGFITDWIKKTIVASGGLQFSAKNQSIIELSTLNTTHNRFRMDWRTIQRITSMLYIL